MQQLLENILDALCKATKRDIFVMLPVKEKNLCYNVLDIFSKNFYGLYIYYRIRELRLK